MWEEEEVVGLDVVVDWEQVWEVRGWYFVFGQDAGAAAARGEGRDIIPEGSGEGRLEETHPKKEFWEENFVWEGVGR